MPDEEAYRKKLEITQGHLSSVVEIMEFGCGTDTAPLIHAAFVRHVHAINISEKIIEIPKGEATFSLSNTSCLGESIAHLKSITPVGKLVSIMSMIKNFTVQENLKTG